MFRKSTGLLTHKTNGKPTIDAMIEVLLDMEYEVHLGQRLVNFGVPQTRRRVYIVGFYKKLFTKQTEFKFPKAKSKEIFMNEIIEKNAKGYDISKHLQNLIFLK